MTLAHARKFYSHGRSEKVEQKSNFKRRKSHPLGMARQCFVQIWMIKEVLFTAVFLFQTILKRKSGSKNIDQRKRVTCSMELHVTFETMQLQVGKALHDYLFLSWHVTVVKTDSSNSDALIC